MFKNISLGIYYPGNSLLHRLQARTKLLLLAWFTVYIVIANNFMWHFAPYVVLIVFSFTGMALSGISLHHVWRRIRLILLLMLLGALTTLFTTDGTVKPVYTLGPLPISFALLRWIIFLYGILLTIYIALFFLPIPALQRISQRRWLKRIRIPLILFTLGVIALLWFMRNIPSAATFPIGPFVITDLGVWLLLSFYTVFVVLYIFSLILTMTTTPIALVEGLTILLTPLRWLRLPVDDFALMTLIALRFIPTLIEEVEQLLKAQIARGADYAHGTIRERTQSLLALFIPLLQGVLRRASDLATALEARGYEVGSQQTRLHEKRLAAIDYSVLAVIAVITVGSLFI
jgi:energy-coupling factor transport system permease protein